jgi:hypothetical protein
MRNSEGNSLNSRLNLLKKCHKCDVLIAESRAKLFQKSWGKFVKIGGNVIYRVRKVLDAVRHPAVILIVKDLVNPELYKHTSLHNFWDVLRLHPGKPFLLNIFINSNGDVIKKHVAKVLHFQFLARSRAANQARFRRL